MCVNFHNFSISLPECGNITLLLIADHVGEEASDYIVSSNFDWKPSIISCLKTYPVNVITHLLCQRPELRENAYLNEQEKEMVDFIKCYFNISNQ